MAGLYRTLFPREPRGFRGRRWVNIALRTLHLVGVAGAGGGLLYAADPALWHPYLWLVIGSGVLMLAVEGFASLLYLIQLRGVAMLLKPPLLGVALHDASLAPWVLVLVLVLSGVMAHAPANVRYFSLLHGRRVDRL